MVVQPFADESFFAQRIMMIGDRDRVAMLVDHLHLGDAAPRFLIDLIDGVVGRDRVAQQHRLQKAHLVVAGRDREITQTFLMDHMSDADGRDRRHISHQQRAVGDAPAEIGFFLHVLVVDVGVAEVAGDAGEQHDVGLADRLGEHVMLSDFHEIEA
jgi:hypothetical protein